MNDTWHKHFSTTDIRKRVVGFFSATRHQILHGQMNIGHFCRGVHMGSVPLRWEPGWSNIPPWAFRSWVCDQQRLEEEEDLSPRQAQLCRWEQVAGGCLGKTQLSSVRQQHRPKCRALLFSTSLTQSSATLITSNRH